MVPWDKSVYPLKRLREGQPLDALELAAHIDQVRTALSTKTTLTHRAFQQDLPGQELFLCDFRSGPAHVRHESEMTMKKASRREHADGESTMRSAKTIARPRMRPAAMRHIVRLVATVGLAGVLSGSDVNARAGFIRIESSSSVSAPDVGLLHKTGATEGKDSSSLDVKYPYDLYNGMAVVDFYAATAFASPYDKLAQEARGVDSYTTYNTQLSGRNLNGSVTAALKFILSDPFNEHDFDNQAIYADLYNASDSIIGTYNVKYLAATGTTIPITINNGLSYKLDIRFEVLGDANGDGVVDAADYIAMKRNFGLTSGATWSQGDFTGDVKVDWDDLQTLMTSFGTGTGGLSAQTPEPASAGLLALGGLGLLAKRKQRNAGAPRSAPSQPGGQPEITVTVGRFAL